MIRIKMNAQNLMERCDEETDELLWAYAEHVHESEDCDDAEDFLSQATFVDLVNNVTFVDLLDEWYKKQGKKKEDCIRGYMEIEGGFLYTHGGGYSFLSADLLGGKADGIARRKFDDFLAEKNMVLI